MASLGEFAIYAIPYGVVEPTTDNGYRVIINHIGLYIKDDFEFDRANWLGLGTWDVVNMQVDKFNISGCHLTNSDFKQWREIYDRGGDYYLYSNVKRIIYNREYTI